MAANAMEAIMLGQHIRLGMIGCGFLAVLTFASATSADSGQWQSWSPGTYSRDDQSATQAPMIYDIAPAMARSAVAEVQFDQAYANLRNAVAMARKQFENAPDTIAAQSELEQAQAAYDEACQPVLADLLDERAYHALIEKRTEMEVALSTPGISSAEKLAVAKSKMEYASAAAKIEAIALAGDHAVREAKLRLDTARQAMLDKTIRFETTLYQQPMAASAQHAFESAQINRVGSEAYLQGAWITRADSLDADERRYPDTQPVQYCAPPAFYWGNPYWWGYYGIQVRHF